MPEKDRGFSWQVKKSALWALREIWRERGERWSFFSGAKKIEKKIFVFGEREIGEREENARKAGAELPTGEEVIRPLTESTKRWQKWLSW